MSWFWFALAAPAIWAAVNHIDKYIVTKYFTGKGIGSLVIFTGLSGFIIAVAILLFNFTSVALSPLPAILIVVNGAILVASFIPYLYVIETEEASWASTLFQMIPVFGYFLGLIFLQEYLSFTQIAGSLLIITGAITISLDLSQKVNLKLRQFLLMALSSFMIAVNGLIFKVVALNQNFWGTAFWEYMGGFIFVVILFAGIPLYRRQFIATIEKSRSMVIGIGIFSELMNVAAKLLANFASLIAPLTLVWVVNSFQPLIVLIYAIILTIFIPDWGKENISMKSLTQKLIAIAVMFLGSYILFK